jgi:hypothetical protein
MVLGYPRGRADKPRTLQQRDANRPTHEDRPIRFPKFATPMHLAE